MEKLLEQVDVFELAKLVLDREQMNNFLAYAFGIMQSSMTEVQKEMMISYINRLQERGF